MSSGWKLRFLLALLPLILAGCRDAPQGKVERHQEVAVSPRGIVLVTVDGWWDPATKTDSIPSDFASNAIRITDAMTPCPQVRPAVCSILTGKSPVETGVRDDVTTPLPAGVPLVSASLTERGWRTAAFIADPRVGHSSGLGRGFEVFDPPKEFLLGSFRRLPKVRNPKEVVSDFSTWIPTIPDDASFFAWVHLARPTIDPRAKGATEDVRTALETLSQFLAGSVRLKHASVMLLGIAGRIDLDEGKNSGYFLSPTVLRVPVLVRSGASGGTVDPKAPFSLVDAARWIAREAGIEAGFQGSPDPTTPRLAWTWRGHNEFGWPAEVAAQRGTALCVRSTPDPKDRCLPWDDERRVEDVDRRACTTGLDQHAQLAQAPLVLPTLPVDLTQEVTKLGLRLPAPRADGGPSVARELRERVVPSITRARRSADIGKAADADIDFQEALAVDPQNFGALIEAGEALALEGRSKLAKARLEPAMRAASWNPEVWHWLGHVSYLEKQIDRAEAQWRVSDVLEANNGDVLYDLACARSLAGDSVDSENYLRRAWQAGFRDVNKIQVDSDLRNLRADPSYLRFMREVVH